MMEEENDTEDKDFGQKKRQKYMKRCKVAACSRKPSLLQKWRSKITENKIQNQMKVNYQMRVHYEIRGDCQNLNGDLLNRTSEIILEELYLKNF